MATEVEKYEVLEKIGHGSFGVIRKVRRKADGYILCRKEINYLQMSPKEREQLQSELSVLKNLRHPNIVAYYEREHLKVSQDLHIYMEYCEEGDLGKRIKELKRSNQMAEEDFVWSVFAQLVTALYRCHYGEDPHEVGKNAIGLGSDAKPVKTKTTHAMILHRDLKPENIFLGSDSSVKLGDFGLSKIMQSHDFASTYVGTPFYMSPEICAAEQYSLHSDIWAFGCIMYELCAKEPPFNAKTHLELIQKIRLGRLKPLSTSYSQTLQDTIAHCLKVNPSQRPDTAQLLNLPMVKLKRKEFEVVRLGRHLKTREELADRALQEAERKLALVESEKQSTRTEIENTVRREWEVKARLEIDSRVQQEIEKLYKTFEVEVNRRIDEILASKILGEEPVRSSTPNGEDFPGEIPAFGYRQSQSTTGETDEFPSTTDLSELSLESPTLQRSKNSKKSSRTPFGRAQTMFVGSPMDVQMVDPSPAPIASLGLSPRRNDRKPSYLSRNIFAAAEEGISGRSSPEDDGILEDLGKVADEEDDSDDVPALPSPTRGKTISGDPFKSNPAHRPTMLRQKTAPVPKPTSRAGTLGSANTSRLPSANLPGSREHARPKPSVSTGKRAPSPDRRPSKLPSAGNIASESPNRKATGPSASPTRQLPRSNGNTLSRKEDTTDMRQAAMLNSHVQGRTLVELAQARGRVQSYDACSDDVGLKSRLSTLNSRGDADAWEDKGKTAPALWDPERDEMPSPFLKRGVLTGNTGGPGFRHLR